jgi:CheY-like chemotaxis protein
MYDQYYHPLFLPNTIPRDGPNRHLSVLVVEDDLNMQRLLEGILKTVDKKMSVDRVTTAEEAKDLLDHSDFDHYDLVIADQFLSGTDTGLDLWNHCRKHHPFVEFMLTSGSEIDKYLAQFKTAARIPVFMIKSLSPQLMRSKIIETLNHVQALTPLKSLLGLEEVPHLLSDGAGSMYSASKARNLNETLWGTALVLYAVTLISFSTAAFSGHGLSFRDIMRAPESQPPVQSDPILNPWEEEMKIPDQPSDLKKIHDFNMNYPKRASK